MEARRDCPDCRSAGRVERGACQVCLAELEPGPGPGSLRFADVVAELETVAALAALGATGNAAEACRRARALLERLRGQFLTEVILTPPGMPPVPGAIGPRPDPVPA
jgi:hypothetical protein